MYGFIYITTNNVNGKKYIGQKKYDSDNKWQSYLGSGIALKNAMAKYGKENFSREIIDYANTRDELNEKEKYWISYYNAVKDKEFYNIASGGDGGDTTLGYTKEQKDVRSKKLSKAFKGVINIGKANNSAKPVICLNTMQIFDCGADADRYYGFNRDTVSNVCNPNSISKTTPNPDGEERLVWEYYYPNKEYVYKPFIRKYTTTNNKKVYCFEDDEIYDSVKTLADRLGAKSSNSLTRALRSDSHIYKTHFHIMYYEDYINSSDEYLDKIRLDVKKKFLKRNGLYENNDKDKGINKKLNKDKRKPVRCIETNIIYESVNEAERKLDIYGVSNCCNGKTKTAGGFTWEFV